MSGRCWEEKTYAVSVYCHCVTGNHNHGLPIHAGLCNSTCISFEQFDSAVLTAHLPDSICSMWWWSLAANFYMGRASPLPTPIPAISRGLHLDSASCRPWKLTAATPTTLYSHILPYQPAAGPNHGPIGMAPALRAVRYPCHAVQDRRRSSHILDCRVAEMSWPTPSTA